MPPPWWRRFPASSTDPSDSGGLCYSSGGGQKLLVTSDRSMQLPGRQKIGAGAGQQSVECCAINELTTETWAKALVSDEKCR